MRFSPHSPTHPLTLSTDVNDDICVGTVHTLASFLSARLPLLFPEPSSGKGNLGYALIQGIPAPSDSEMAWLGACMAGADGWVNVCVGLLREGGRYP